MEKIFYIIPLIAVLLILYMSYKMKYETKKLRQRVLNGESDIICSWYNYYGERERCEVLGLTKNGVLIRPYYSDEQFYTNINNLYAY